ncbi:recombinase family protein [Cyanobium sp. LEGE 06143]|uniref:recombinase zinc beta ribbon domain-containing protein n=1 Tax=Cyanobium sp. LEGE 06143 TaxID=945727 RepID=UPI0019F6BF94|nr:recombinase family protein [Cyanobium sp. LEGE 06143]
MSGKAQAGLDRSGLERQEQALQHWLADHPDFTLAEALVDPGVSAGSGRHRTTGALGKFLAAARAGTVPAGSCLVVESMSRFSREAERQVLSVLLSDFWAAGLGIAFCSDGGTVIDAELIDREPHRLHGLLGAMAQARREWEERSRRSKGACAHRQNLQNEGQRTPGRAPWWIARDPVTWRLQQDAAGQLVIEPERGRALRRAAELATAGMGTTLIAQQLQEEGFPPPPTDWARNSHRDKPRKWTAGIVSGALRSPALVGVLARKNVPDLPSYYPRLLSDEEHLLMRAQIEKRDRLKGRLRGTAHRIHNIFQGVIRCGCCGGPIVYCAPTKAARKGHPGYLHCPAARRSGPCANRGYVMADQAESHMLTRLAAADWESLLPPDQDDTADRQRLEENAHRLQIELDATRDRLSAVQKRAERAWLDGVSEDRQVVIEGAMASLRAELQGLEERHSQAAAELAQVSARPNPLQAAADLRKRVLAFWRELEAAGPQERLAFNRSLLAVEPSLEFRLWPALEEGGQKLIELRVGDAPAGFQPLAGAARTLARQQGAIAPRLACQWQRPGAVLAMMEPANRSQRTLQVQTEKAVIDASQSLHSGLLLRRLARLIEAKLAELAHEGGEILHARRGRRLAVVLAVRQLRGPQAAAMPCGLEDLDPGVGPVAELLQATLSGPPM